MKKLKSKIKLLGYSLLASASAMLTLNSASYAAGQDLIVIAAPSISDTYDDPEYAELFQGIVDFDIAYANAVYGNDEVRIVVDAQTRPYFAGKVPEEIIINDYLPHIWARDYTVINPSKPVQFRYTPVTFEGDQTVADEMQDGFNAFATARGLKFGKTKYMLDGGNIVDNHAGRVITTTRFLEDNDLSYEDGKAVLKELLNAKEVAILPPDEEVMAHSDGMVMFAEENTLILNRYDEPMYSEILEELETSFPGIKIVDVDAMWDETNPSSACGVNVNAAMTRNFIYMPHFGDKNSDKVMKTIQANTSKKVIAVPANSVCKLGGSVRCLTLQLKGTAAQAFLQN
ncbi:Agmatine/peptidylarginine deiminase [Pseudovibrio denitrificans]|uniref:Agmatine/peptidylarginine deiminase n=2 Tax=Pseudovibrio denitrificans TaxID=258256 RepID=A0A1I7D3C2_9HYPH|nr:agmatine deiminase family protein [Pseudovibrio denitrificans]SFU06137.1 Agmatine/peptidylarginine deiminase [Pseudovibrio denitrificans]